MSKSVFVAVLAGLLITGCAMVGPDYEQPKVAMPSKWRFSDSEARETVNTLWWKEFNDPMLDRLIERAVRNNLDLQKAIAAVEKFMGAYGSTRANLFPQIYGTASYSRLNNGMNQLGGNLPGGLSSSSGDINYARLGATMEWEIDLWGQLRRAREAARADLLAQEAYRRTVLLTVVSQVAITYVTLRELDCDLEITRNIMKTLESELRIARSRFREGYSSELEVNQVESEYIRRAAYIPQYEQSIAETEHALKILLGENPGPVPRGRTLDELHPLTVPAGLPSDVLARRPDILQAEQELVASNALIGVARGEYFPKILLTGDVGQTTSQLSMLFTPGANFWSAGSSLLLPILTAGKIAGHVQSAEAVQRSAVANYQLSILTAFKEFEDALVGHTKTREQRELQSARVKSAEKYFRLSKLQYDEGYTDYITVLDSLRQSFDAQIELANVKSSNIAAAIKLYRAMGGGWVAQAESNGHVPEPREAAMFP
ncbi:efflux transporter outer membrane subunit [Candidatus Methylospira mobilis]|nr:efflux transporter outer membrane subunit [Candidatus Methylospira mobilis]WNV05503.1 efflux transporter outer membrane subunit [Candidatus Methylospira mobilis]